MRLKRRNILGIFAVIFYNGSIYMLLTVRVEVEKVDVTWSVAYLLASCVYPKTRVRPAGHHASNSQMQLTILFHTNVSDLLF